MNDIKLSKEELYRRQRMIESLGFSITIVPTYGYADFWWDLENDFMVFPNDKKYHKKFVKAIEALEARGFGKED